jgi:predicted aminopeptidase
MEQELTPSEANAREAPAHDRREPERAPLAPRRHRVWRAVRRVLLVLLLLAIAFLALTRTGQYLVRAAWEEGRILARRQPIAELVNDPATPARVRDKLRLVLAARAFAQDVIHLRARQSFTTYSRLDRDTLVLVLSGAYRDRLEPYTWWFPIVGRVPYKGFFDFGMARAAARSLEVDGFDAYLRPSPAFSTLGWFNDPLLSTSLRADSLDLANTVIHELTHNTFYAPGQAVFNESFANFVGARGAAWFFRSRGDTASAAEEDARWSDEKVMAQFWDRLYRTLDSAYDAYPNDRSARLAARDSIYGDARQRLVHELGPKLRTIGPRALERIRLDNAALLARRIYLTDLDLFDAIHVRSGCDLRTTITRVIEIAKANEKAPYDGLREWILANRSLAVAWCGD